jgi:predicted glycoside hydrolase/deacetylase ChbG (UPF0249 family)
VIVNADDYGVNRNVTETTLECFEDGVISSTTAMVWMSDSDRAAKLARQRNLPVGLHLNLTLPFNSTLVPEPVRERQHALVPHLSRRARGGTRVLQRRPTKLLADVVREQLARFAELYGPPTHIDGHHHIHLDPWVIELLPADVPLRAPLRHPRSADRQIRRDHRKRRPAAVSDVTFAFEHLHPALGGEGFSALTHPAFEVIEVMAHPTGPGQRTALGSDVWRATLARLRTGSYASLGVGPEVPSRS